MTPDDEAEIVRLMREARDRSRGYASFFGWSPNRDLEELGALWALAESLECDGARFFDQIKIRGRGNDPPDLEALDSKGSRIAFEITELVDGNAIRAFKAGDTYEWAEWPREKFLETIAGLLAEKAKKLSKLKDAPYPGGYVVVVFSDEPEIRMSIVSSYLDGHVFAGLAGVDRAFLVLSYDPTMERCPYVELALAT